MNKTLRNCAISGGVAFLLLLPLFILGVLNGIDKLIGGWLFLYHLLSVAFTLFISYYIWGFIIIGRITKNKLLIVSSWLTISLSIITLVFALISNKAGIALFISFLIFIVVVGIVNLIFGISLLKLQEHFGNLATATAVLNIVSGASLFVILFFFIALVLFIPLAALEIILMLKAAYKFR